MLPRVIAGAGLLFLIFAGLSHKPTTDFPSSKSSTTQATQSEKSDTKGSVSPASPTTQTQATSPTTHNCTDMHVGYTVTKINGRTVSIWYPTEEQTHTYAYSNDFSSSLAVDAEPSTCTTYPLVVFSHGLGGCKTQTTFFTEELARSGYIVAAPDHKDALCGTSGAPVDLTTDASFLEPDAWSDTSEIDRRNDMTAVISGMLSSGTFKKSIDRNNIGIAGHSLGGYTALGLAGGWNSWRDSRIKAVLAMSPYAMPFIAHDTLKNIRIPVMYQGAMFDIGITPSLKGPDGAYAHTPSPAYYVELIGGTHFEWTNLLCAGKKTSAECISGNTNAQLINRYGIAFFDTYLKGRSSAVLTSKQGLAEYLTK